MPAVVEQVLGAVEAGRRITIHGDFDVDGVCATSILVSTLRGLGADCDWLIPDRMADGYGLSADNVRKLVERGTQLLITADCGITAVDEVKLAQELGMDVIVTDHHQPGDELPDCPILHPELDGYPFKDLCGTAVAWKLSCALRGAASGAGSPGRHSPGVPGDPAPDAASGIDTDLDLVALATVADVVPLVGENRSLVRRGLEEVRRAQRPGMRALLKAAKCDPSQLDEGDLAFRLGPRINAAGRLYRADAGVELFLTSDEERAAEIANELNRANGERRATEREVANAAEAAMRELPEDLRAAPVIVVAGRGWHPGVIGIVASRLVEKHHRPAVVISLDDAGEGRGSGRSIPGFDLLAGLEACSEHLAGFGGHKAAAGLQIEESSLDAFREAFAAHAASVLGPEDLKRTERIDAIVGGASLGLDLAEELRQLAPFGMGNPGVRLLVPSARVRDVRTMGEGKHARFSLHSGSHRALGVAFGRPSLGVGEDDLVDVAVRLEVNRWNGAVEPQVILREVYPRSRGGGRAEAEAWWRALRGGAGPGSGRVAAPRSPRRARARAPGPQGHECPRSGGQRAGLFLQRGRVGACSGRRAARRHGRRGGAPCRLRGAGALSPARRRLRHVVLVDPPPTEPLLRLASFGQMEGGYLHRVWGEAEWRFALSSLAVQLPQRPTLIAAFRDLREAGAVSGEDLREALLGNGPHPRRAETAARCFRVLAELGLVQGEPEGGAGKVGVVSSEGTDLERSASFRAYSARYQEATNSSKDRDSRSEPGAPGPTYLPWSRSSTPRRGRTAMVPKAPRPPR